MIYLILEVIDKEPSLVQLVVLFGTSGVGGFLASRWQRWTLFLVLPLTLFLGCDTVAELTNPYIGPAILNEAGSTHVLAAYACVIIGNVLPITGIFLSRRPQRSS